MHRAMEQTRYWMWARRRLGESPLLSSQTPPMVTNSSYNSSWEEQAFAQDSAGQLGDCKWPPRSYSCSFCRREFQSAQALGGHMNVHRRDRARLKQSPGPTSESYDEDHHAHHISIGKTIGAQDSLQVGSPVCSSSTFPYPNSGAIASSPLSPSGVSLVASTSQENCSEHPLISPYSSSHIRKDRKEFLASSTLSLKISIPVPVQGYAIPDLNLGRENLRLRKAGCQVRRDPDEDDEVTIRSKRRRSDPTILFSLGPSLADGRQQTQTELLKLSLSPVEELDLELRLGDPPKVK